MGQRSAKRASAKQAEVDFDATPSERLTIRKIVKRATEKGLCGGKHWYTPIDAEMDLVACHRNGSPLRLSDLLAADDFNFTHDIVGIARHMDRATGKLAGLFRPRFARPVSL